MTGPLLTKEAEDLDAEVARLRAELAKHQNSEFHPDWSLLKATQQSLREHMALLRAAQAELETQKLSTLRLLHESEQAAVEAGAEAIGLMVQEERAACAEIVRRVVRMLGIGNDGASWSRHVGVAIAEIQARGGA